MEIVVERLFFKNYILINFIKVNCWSNVYLICLTLEFLFVWTIAFSQKDRTIVSHDGCSNYTMVCWDLCIMNVCVRMINMYVNSLIQYKAKVEYHQQNICPMSMDIQWYISKAVTFERDIWNSYYNFAYQLSISL